jgi:hypothetical protein
VKTARAKVMNRYTLLLLVAVLSLGGCAHSGTGGTGGERECGACAPTNPQVVPDVVGTKLGRACARLAAKGYGGGVREIVSNSGEPKRTILRLETRAGTHGGLGQIIMMHVAGPLSLHRLPRGCFSRIPGTF